MVEPDYAGTTPEGEPHWYMASSAAGTFQILYCIVLSHDGYRCDCRAGRFHTTCKHIKAVERFVSRAMAAQSA